MVSIIGLGGIPIQGVSEEEAKSIINKCHEMGINFIDTARGYSISEELIGEGIKENREKWIIATKSPVLAYEEMKNEIDTSLSKLKTNYIDLYQIHNVKDKEAYNKIMEKDGSYRALLEAKEQGKIKHIGITSHSVELLEAIIDEEKFSTIQFPYNPIENQGEKLFERAKELNIGVIAMKPEVLILDEPTAGLDPKGRDEILQQIKNLHNKYKITVILVSHSMEDIARLVDKILVMHRGKLALIGTPKEIFKKDQTLREIGLGVPQITIFAKKLKEKGIAIPDDILTVEEAKNEIIKLIRSNKNA